MSRVEPEYIEVNSDIKLRRFIFRNSSSKGTILLLHGFPETIYTWTDVALLLSPEFEVHCFDWPGYGLSSRPTADKFSYSPVDYAKILKLYIQVSGIDSSKLLVYATDIGALPALLLALEEPTIMRGIIVGDFAPFDRPEYMYENLKLLKVKESAEEIRDYMNNNKDNILETVFKNGLTPENQFEISKQFKEDINNGWNYSTVTSVDAFYYYYNDFTRDENYFESNLDKLQTPVKIVWGEIDFYIKKEMGIELSEKINAEVDILPGVSHFPHLQRPQHVYHAVASFV